MKNTVYQVNNSIYRDVFLSIVAAIAVIYYAVAKAMGTESGLSTIDWVILGILSLASVFFINKAIKRSQVSEE